MENIFATFADINLAERAVAALLDHGGTVDCISLISNTSNTDPVKAAQHGVTTTTGADAGHGALTGAGIGLGLGILGALASLIIPGFGIVIGGGALATAIGAAAATTAAGAISGGVAGYLRDQGVPEMAAHQYQEDLNAGRVLLSVGAPCGKLDLPSVEELLAKYGALNATRYGPPVQVQPVVAAQPSQTFQSPPVPAQPLQAFESAPVQAPPVPVPPVPAQPRAVRPVQFQAPPTQPMPVIPEQPVPVEQPVREQPAMQADEAQFEAHYRTHMDGTGVPFAEYLPAYRFGYALACKPALTWEELQPDVRGEWEMGHPDTWDQMQMCIRYGWESYKSHVA
ncbi:MAG TPA: hypothetical protein VGO93_20570 [Candidatus Xenobia bacterium]|jgi:hypothetical protein